MMSQRAISGLRTPLLHNRNPYNRGMPSTPDIAPLASATNLYRLVLIRALMMAGQLGAIAYAYWSLQAPLRYDLLLGTLAVLGLVNLATWRRVRTRAPIGAGEIFLQLLVDVVGLSLQLFLSGGAANPFVSYLLVPICIAAVMLPAGWTALVTFAGLLAYSILLFVYLPLASLMPAPATLHEGHLHGGTRGLFHVGQLNLHILGMWANFAVSAVLIAFFVVRMARTVREQQALLNERREAELRERQIVAIASLAAGTAHELGTPLNTMALIADDLCRELQGHAAAEDARVLREQATRCRQILGSLRRAADVYHDDTAQLQSLVVLVDDCLSDWQLLRPAVRYRCRHEAPPGALCLADSTLKQAILNVLNNAADAQADAGAPGTACPPIEVGTTLDGEELRLEIRDHGDGDPALLDEHGARPFHARDVATGGGRGIGLGVFLSRSSVERLRGSLEFSRHPDGGIVARIRLPLRSAAPRAGGER